MNAAETKRVHQVTAARSIVAESLASVDAWLTWQVSQD